MSDHFLSDNYIVANLDVNQSMEVEAALKISPIGRMHVTICDLNGAVEISLDDLIAIYEFAVSYAKSK